MGVGFVAVIIAAVKIADYFSERYPSKKKREEEFRRLHKLVSERNLIMIPDELYSWVIFSRENAKGFQESIEAMRREFWQKDIIVPYFRIEVYPEADKNESLIKIEGNEVYSGSLYEDVDNTTPQQAEALLIQKLRDYFTAQLNGEKKEEVAEIE